MHKKNTPNDWENPQVVDTNKLPAHAALLPYPNLEMALGARRDESSGTLDRYDTDSAHGSRRLARHVT